MARMISAILKRFRSLRFTVMLMVCLLAIFLLGLVIPQQGLLGDELYGAWKASRPKVVAVLEFFSLTNIYTAPVTLALWGLFFLNLIVVMSVRIPMIWRRAVDRSIPRSTDEIKASRLHEPIPGEDAERGMWALKGSGYTVFSETDAFRAIKNRFSPLATILFHLSFFLVLVGGVVSFYTKFTAYAAVAVGETFDGHYLRTSPPKIGRIPHMTFSVEKVKPTYFARDLPVDLSVWLSTSQGNRTIGINKP